MSTTIALKPWQNPDPFALFCFATAYWKARFRLAETHKLLYPYTMPIFVTEAFAFELFLKAVVRDDGKIFTKRHHEPEDLFALLRPKTRVLIRKYANMGIADMRSVMKRADGVYTRLRYMHEGHDWNKHKDQWGNAGFNTVIHAIRKVLLERHLDWNEKKNALLGIA